ncbi:hypothetical protein AVEN_202985-1 [Araneus ventricosus]|uniref:Uncharacterized protein n=1 Tax=Araneus ventricosus TaxID=182803 RepID=A0A4Y2V2F6_ARAVE|nr:hypothetical protein AVEN_109449-1 [Araneus ventricosus]GBO19418.1 hypothetical protein AVEN_202985-1 [Araneus ventricosus]
MARKVYRGFTGSQANEPRPWRQNEASRKCRNYDPILGAETSRTFERSLCDVTSCRKSAVNRKSVRRILYDKKVSKTLSSKFNLLTFPLSAEASKHPLHVYLQVQQWLWNDLDTTEWGWLMKDGTE